METRREIEAELMQHFIEILSKDGGDRGMDIGQITCLIPRVVTRENNEMLTKAGDAGGRGSSQSNGPGEISRPRWIYLELFPLLLGSRQIGGP